MKVRLILWTPMLAVWILVSACSSDEEMVDASLDSPPVTTPDNTSNTPTPDPLEIIDEDAPLAVISTRSLRVRAEPSDDAEVIGAVKQRQIYTVLALSADGKYVELEISDVPGGSGWVDTNFVTIQGDITNIERGIIPNTKTPVDLPIPTPILGDATNAVVKTDGQRLRVRKEANANAAIVGRVTNGERVTMIETSQDGKWVKIAGDAKDNPEGGWVALEFLDVEK